MYLSKSKYCLGVQCKKILWLDKNHPEEREEINNESVLENGNEVGKLAKDLFGFHIDVNFSENLNEMISDTEKLLKLDKVVITEASFVYENNFCSVDILKKDGENFEIYEVKSASRVKDINLDDISYQTYILLNLGYNVTKCSLVHLNGNYVRHGELELDKLFKVEDVTDIVLSKQNNVKKNIKEINEYMNSLNEKDEVSIKCFEPYKCPYFNYCTGHLNKQNVFNINGLLKKKKIELYKKGIITYKDLLNSDINDKYKDIIKIELGLSNPYINKDNIKKFLNSLSYPLYFLDFETFGEPIPKFDGIRPYMKIPFQYSLHYILEKGGKLLHKEFLADAGVDPRRSLAEKLTQDIPMNVCTLAYNMSFEKGVIKNLADLYPDLSEHLINIHDNMKDLMIPFKDDYYTKNRYGFYSIKYVLPSLFPNDPSLNYQNLEGVHNGGEASNGFANMSKLGKEEQIKLRENLLKYCYLDTYAMVKVLEKLEEITEYVDA